MSTRTSTDLITADLARMRPAESYLGTFVSQSGTAALVNVAGSTITVKSESAYPPIAGEAVRLERRGADIILLGPAIARSATGRVTVTGSPQCTVEYPNGSGVTKLMPYPSGYTPAVGDIVLINWDSNGAIQAKLTQLPGVVVPDVLPPTGPQLYHPPPFTAIDSGTFQSGSWWTTDVYSSSSTTSAWFYGSKIKDTIPDGATIISAAIYLPAKQALYGPPQFGRHASPTKPAGAVSFSALADLGGRSGWTAIPAALIEHLKANDGGLGVSHGGYTIWHGVATDGLSGALDIIYRI